MSLVHDHLRLHITNDSFYIESLNAGSSAVLVIDRINYDIHSTTNNVDIPPSVAESKEIFGIFGVIRLVNGPNLIVITGRSRVGDILGHTVWAVTDTEIIPYRRSVLNLTESQKSDNEIYLAMLKESLDTKSYYFCTSYDITHSMQRLASAADGFHAESLCSRADNRFFWNCYALREMIDRPELHNFCIPIMQGFIEIVSCFVKGRTFDLILISRRSTLRAGTRYYVRGLNEQGDAANFVETEQIMIYNQQTCSLVQTRGSIPLVWSQRPNLRYKPSPQLTTDEDKHLHTFRRHFDQQIVIYGKQVMINLVNHKGSELVLAKAFLDAVNRVKYQELHYEAFDFHAQCGQTNWDRLSILMDRISLDQDEFGYFMQGRDGEVFMRQSGVFRSNCMDCLDRTNVVQSLIARRSLTKQLIQLGIFTDGDNIENEAELDTTMKYVWADNADYCSKQYAGTGALKTDFTRTGKRTVSGLMNDGLNSAIRYYKNNFHDGFRQDSIDLMLGNYVVSESTRSPFEPATRRSHLPAILLAVYVFFSFVVIFALIPAAGNLEQLSYVALWASATALLAVYVMRRGDEIVNSPTLVHTKEKTD